MDEVNICQNSKYAHLSMKKDATLIFILFAILKKNYVFIVAYDA